MTLPDFLTPDEPGEIRFTGHRLSLFSVIDRYQQGYSAEMLAEEFPTLTLPLIHRVIAFYLENVVAIDAYVSAFRDELERLEGEHVPGPAVQQIRQRLAARQRTQVASCPEA